ncbi:MAG TPA: hypothetical protein VIK02_05235 [Candidatus Anoxymicrobiaceae bacterium]
MEGQQAQGGRQGARPPERRRKAGKASFNRGLGALAIAGAGYLIGFLIPLASSSGTGQMVFFPIGGIFSFFMAVTAIVIGRKVRQATAALSDEQRQRAAGFVDIDRQRTFAAWGIALGVTSIVFNPLLGFALYSAIR